MPYGTVKVDNITFDNGGADQNVTASGIYRAITSGVTVSGTISGAVIIGGTSVSGTAVRGTTVTGTTVQGVSGTFTTLTGVTTTGTTANFASGVFTTRISGLTVTGTTAQFTSGTFVSLTGTTVTGTTINAGTVNSTTGTFTSLTGTTITGVTVQGTTVVATTGNFTSLTGITTTGTTANFASGIFTTQVSGLTVTGTQSSFTSGNFITLSGSSVQGGTGTFTSGVFASGLSAANPSISFVNDPNTGLWSPGADTLAVSTNSTERARIDSSGRFLVGTSTARNAGGGFQTTVGPQLFIEQPSTGLTAATFLLNRNDSNGPKLIIGRSRGTALGSNTIVQSGDELAQINFVGADGTDLETIAAQIRVQVDGTPGTDDMPGRLVFSTTADGASSPTDRMRIRSDGNIGIGGTGSSNVTLHNLKEITGGVQAYANFTQNTVQSDVTSNAWGHRTTISTAAAAFTLSDLRHYDATQSTIGAGSAVTNQYGFFATASLSGATNNYGFYGAIASATGDYNFYAAGTAPNYFAGDVRTNTVVTKRQAPTQSDTSVTVTAASLIDGLRVGNPAAGINYTLPTGTNMDAAFQELQINQSFEWSVINVAGAIHAITVVQNTNHTVQGNMVVAANSSGQFLTRKTAANTFTSYRIA
jgi:hypothetical protein